MKLKSARIKHFKRFVDLTIRNLPTDAKLVVLLGPNGCGKSSLFDAFQRSLKVDQFYGMSNELRRYYQRSTSEGIAESDDVSLEFHGGNPTSELRNLSTTLRHRRFLFTDSFLLLWKWRVG